MFACIYLRELVDNAAHTLRVCAQRFAPEAELNDPRTVLFDASRLHRLYGSFEQISQAIGRHADTLGLGVNVAIAPTTETARIAAQNFTGITVIPEESLGALNSIDIENLPLTSQLSELFEAWGIRSFQDLAQLPEEGIAERLGPEGVYLRRMARGAAHRPLRIFKPEVQFEERIELEHALINLEPLLFIISRILNNQCGKLQSHGMATNEVSLVLEQEKQLPHKRDLHLPLPMRESKSMLKLLQLDLEAHPPEAAILAVTLILKPVQPRTVQNGMFRPITPEPDKLEVTLARIRALVGQGNVGVAELLNTHRPAPFRLVSQQPEITQFPLIKDPAICIAFRYFQPSIQAQVELKGEHPIRLAAGSIRGNVITDAGPWRTSGDWWTGDSWDRDEWDVSLNDGGVYRIFRNRDGAWFIEGTYD